MPVSRRNFFVQITAEAIENITKIFPKQLTNSLGLNETKPLSPEEAAFALAKISRTNRSKPDNINKEKMPEA